MYEYSTVLLLVRSTKADRCTMLQLTGWSTLYLGYRKAREECLWKDRITEVTLKGYQESRHTTITNNDGPCIKV